MTERSQVGGAVAGDRDGLSHPWEGRLGIVTWALLETRGVGALHDGVGADVRQLDRPDRIAGPDRAALEREARASGRAIEFRGWVDKQESARLLAGASMLIFPSRGPESLSRVLIEASALGVPIAAMDTGGTRDIVEHDVTGLLSRTPGELARDVRRLREDAALRRRLGDAAQRKVERDFDADTVVQRIETLYADVLARANEGPRVSLADSREPREPEARASERAGGAGVAKPSGQS